MILTTFINFIPLDQAIIEKTRPILQLWTGYFIFVHKFIIFKYSNKSSILNFDYILFVVFFLLLKLMNTNVS